ncbi:hypothetical protein BDW75DRAFT_242799 [Aspergillus navahoensis]
MHGQCVDGGAVLNLRLLNHVVINSTEGEGEKTGRIGGGVVIGDLLSVLKPHGLVTPFGAVSSVGYVGSSAFGLGIDQIIAAKIVDTSGNIIDSDRELLKSIKGAGCCIWWLWFGCKSRNRSLPAHSSSTRKTSRPPSTSTPSAVPTASALTLTKSVPAALNTFPGILPCLPMPTPIFALLGT